MNKANKGISIYAYVFLAPTIIFLLLYFGAPLINSIRYAFSNYKLTDPDNIYFNGITNFMGIFTDTSLVQICVNTLVYVVSTVLMQFLLGLGLALLLKKPFKGRGIYQSVVFIPWAFSGFVVGLMFRWSFNGEYGVVNDILLRFNVIAENINWLATPQTGMFVSIVAMVWMGIPFFGILLLASLQSIPEEIYESAVLDGCTGIKSFWFITLPFIKPTIITTVLLRTIWIFNSFELIMIITGFGPAGLTNTLASYMYNKAFTTYDFGMASAIGLIFMVGLCIYSIVVLKITKGNESEV